jgi:RNA polymerase subunit RPABC4/transcription elongation factor Spt4
MMGCSFTYTLIQALECKLCKQFIDNDTVVDTRTSVKLFGAKGYSVCPACGQPNPEQKITKRWRDKVDKYMTKTKERYEQEIHG